MHLGDVVKWKAIACKTITPQTDAEVTQTAIRSKGMLSEFLGNFSVNIEMKKEKERKQVNESWSRFGSSIANAKVASSMMELVTKGTSKDTA